MDEDGEMEEEVEIEEMNGEEVLGPGPLTLYASNKSLPSPRFAFQCPIYRGKGLDWMVLKDVSLHEVGT